MRHEGTKELTTDRLILRRFRKEDAESAFSWLGDPEVCLPANFPVRKNIDCVRAETAERVLAYRSPTVLNWLIEHDDLPIGCISVETWKPRHDSCRLAFMLKKSAWGQGFLPEALTAVTRYLLYTVCFHRVEIRHLSANARCGAAVKKAGFVFEGRLRGAHKSGEKRLDILVYSALRGEYPEF